MVIEIGRYSEGENIHVYYRGNFEDRENGRRLPLGGNTGLGKGRLMRGERMEQ